MKTNRRSILGTGLALAGLAGTITSLDSSARAATTPSTGPVFASWGWEVTNLDDNGADAYLKVENNMIVNSIDSDIAFMITGPPGNAGFAEVLCRAAVSRGEPPKFYHGDPGASFVSPQSPNFSKTHIYNPNHLNIGDDGWVLQNIFQSIILKAWVPDSGTASSTFRNVSGAPGLVLNAGDYLVFNMSHAGVPGDAEWQVVLQYTLS